MEHHQSRRQRSACVLRKGLAGKQEYAGYEEFKDNEPLEVMACEEVLMRAAIKSAVFGLWNGFKEMKRSYSQ